MRPSAGGPTREEEVVMFVLLVIALVLAGAFYVVQIWLPGRHR
jgi:hypothetical protein